MIQCDDLCKNCKFFDYGEFNYDGYNLLYNLDKLCKVFEYEMR